MKIHDAARLAGELGKGIRRRGGEVRDIIVPTNTYNCCMGILLDDTRPEEELKIGRCWNPCPEDLVADDWEMVEIDLPLTTISH